MKKVVLVTEKGMVLKMESSEIRTTSRGGKGVRGMNLEDGDKIVSAFEIEEEAIAG